MKIWGLTEHDLEDIASDLGLVTYNMRQSGRAVALTLRPGTSDTYRMIKVNNGRERRAWAVCWHGHYAFMLACFDRGATRIQSIMADYRSRDDFIINAPHTANLNVGSQLHPVQAREECNCALEGMELYA